MASEPGAGTLKIIPAVAKKPIRVDNWGNFLAQRIEALYDKQEHCDITLRFPHGDLKAHSLVLHACTPFFTNLLKGKTSGHKILKMPPQISSATMAVILKFVYTGRLEAPFSVDLLYSTAKLLKLQILIRLLEAQMHCAESAAVGGGDDVKPFLLRPTAPSPVRPAAPLTPSRPIGVSPGRPRGSGRGIKQLYQPTNSQLAAKRSIVRAADPPDDVRPSRFEFPETENLEMRLPVMQPSLPRRPSLPPAVPRAAPAAPLLRPTPPADREQLFDHLRQTPAKRPRSPQQNGDGKRPRPDGAPPPPPADVTVLREYSEEQRRRAQLLQPEDPDDPDALGDAEPGWQGAQTPGAAAGVVLIKGEPGEPPQVVHTPQRAPAAAPATPGTPFTPRPILKQEPTPGGSASKKRVQFSEESPQLTMTVSELGDTSELVAELLKQHPEVLRGGQNVKVRLVTQSSSGSPARSEYIMVKQQGAGGGGGGGPPAETLDTPLSCTLCARQGRQADFWWADQMTKHFQDEHGDASAIDLNTLACTACVQAGDPIEFAKVDDYLAHLREVHDARGVSDSGTCQLCGYSAPKKLQLMYHQYTKHRIQPPRFITFPKCDRCEFEAISDSELAMHRQRRHKISKEYRCKDCGVLFTNLSLLEGHMRTVACRQGSDAKRRFEWKCDYCGMSFSRSYNLKGHMRSVHKMPVEPRRPPPAVKLEPQLKEEPAAAPAAAAPDPELDPSSEAESMSTVANSVAASLSLAVDGEYMALPDGIVPVEDENGMISYIALRPAAAGAGAAQADGVMEVAQYSVPVVVSGAGPGQDTVTIQVEQVGGSGPGASAGESVLPDLGTPRRSPQAAPARPAATSIDLPQPAAPQIALVSVPQLQTVASPSAPERRRAAAANSRISVSSSEVRVSDLAEPASILPDLPAEPPAGQLEYTVAEVQHGQLVMSGMGAGHVIVSGVQPGQEVILAGMEQGQLYQVHHAADVGVAGLQQGQEIIVSDLRQEVAVAGLEAGQQMEMVDADGRPVDVASIQHGQQFDVMEVQEEADLHQEESVAESPHGEEASLGQTQDGDVSQMNMEVQHDQEVGSHEQPGEEDVSMADVQCQQENTLNANDGQDIQQGEEVLSGLQHSQDAGISQVEYSVEASSHEQEEHLEVASDDVSADQTLDETVEESRQHIDESVAHFPPDESSELQASALDETVEESRQHIDESVAHFPPDESAELQASTLDETVESRPRIDESVAHFPPDESELQVSTHDATTSESRPHVDESVAHFPADESELLDSTLEVTTSESREQIDESVAHFPADKTELEVSVEASHLQESHHSIDVSVAHFPAGEVSVSGAKPGEDSLAEDQTADSADASTADDTITNESQVSADPAGHPSDTARAVPSDAVGAEQPAPAAPEPEPDDGDLLMVIEEGDAAAAGGAEAEAGGAEAEAGMGDGEVLVGGEVGEEVVIGGEPAHQVAPDPGDAWEEVMPAPPRPPPPGRES